tara:strand:+ start:497 stop:1075 length:579 start_codon:yes stop_codon:yes gene_type:complete
MTTFKQLNQIDVNLHTEKKGRFTYLSWAWAWQQLLARYPDSTRTVYELDGLPYIATNQGVMVKVGVTVNGIEHIEYLPVMNHQNKCIPADKANMMDINKAIQRCTVKAIARHGLGLYIYAGEDLPDSEPEPKPEPQKQTWQSLAEPPPEKPELLPDTQRFNLCKNWLQKPTNTIEKLRERYTISKEVEELLK